MEDNQKPSLLRQYIGILVFILMSIGAFYGFGYFAIDTVEQLISHSSSISFDKGAFYLLGVGIGLGALVIGMIIEVWKKQPPSDRVAKRVMRTAILGLAIMFLFPQLVHYAIADYLAARDYGICQEASHQWLQARTIVYTDNPETCLQLANEKNNKVTNSNKVRSTANELY